MKKLVKDKIIQHIYHELFIYSFTKKFISNEMFKQKINNNFVKPPLG